MPRPGFCISEGGGLCRIVLPLTAKRASFLVLAAIRGMLPLPPQFGGPAHAPLAVGFSWSYLKRQSPGSAPKAAFKRQTLPGCLSFSSVLISDSTSRRGSSLPSAAPSARGARLRKRPHMLLASMTFNSRINETAEKPLEVGSCEVILANNWWQTAKVRRNKNLLKAKVSRR